MLQLISKRFFLCYLYAPSDIKAPPFIRLPNSELMYKKVYHDPTAAHGLQARAKNELG